MPGPIVIYGVSIQQAIKGGDLGRMKELAAEAEAHLANPANAGDAEVKAHLDLLKAEIAKAEGSGD